MQLFTFIFGMLFIAYLMPMIDAFSTYIVQLFNLLIIKLQVKGEEAKAEVEAEVDEGTTHAMGFDYENRDVKFEEEEDEDDE